MIRCNHHTAPGARKPIAISFPGGVCIENIYAEQAVPNASDADIEVLSARLEVFNQAAILEEAPKVAFDYYTR